MCDHAGLVINEGGTRGGGSGEGVGPEARRGAGRSLPAPFSFAVRHENTRQSTRAKPSRAKKKRMTEKKRSRREKKKKKKKKKKRRTREEQERRRRTREKNTREQNGRSSQITNNNVGYEESKKLGLFAMKLTWESAGLCES